MSIRAIRDSLLIVVILIFLPYESRLFWFHTKPGDWYGELGVVVDDQIYIFSKNSSGVRICPGLETPFSGVTWSHNENIGLDSKEDQAIPPSSYAILVSGSKLEPREERVARTDGGNLFRVPRLHIATPAEKSISFFFYSLFLLGFVILSYSVIRYIFDSKQLTVGAVSANLKPNRITRRRRSSRRSTKS